MKTRYLIRNLFARPVARTMRKVSQPTAAGAAGGPQAAVHVRRQQPHRHTGRRRDRLAPGDRPGQYNRGERDDHLRQNGVQDAADDHPERIPSSS